MIYIEHKDLKAGETYYVTAGDYVYIVKKGYDNFYIREHANTFDRHFNFYKDHGYNYALASSFEKLWLDECISQGKFIPRSEIKTESYEIY